MESGNIEFPLTITWEPMDIFRHMRALFGVVFHAKSNGEVTETSKKA